LSLSFVASRYAVICKRENERKVAKMPASAIKFRENEITKDEPGWSIVTTQ